VVAQALERDEACWLSSPRRTRAALGLRGLRRGKRRGESAALRDVARPSGCASSSNAGVHDRGGVPSPASPAGCRGYAITPPEQCDIADRARHDADRVEGLGVEPNAGGEKETKARLEPDDAAIGAGE